MNEQFDETFINSNLFLYKSDQNLLAIKFIFAYINTLLYQNRNSLLSSSNTIKNNIMFALAAIENDELKQKIVNILYDLFGEGGVNSYNCPKTQHGETQLVLDKLLHQIKTMIYARDTKLLDICTYGSNNIIGQIMFSYNKSSEPLNFQTFQNVYKDIAFRKHFYTQLDKYMLNGELEIDKLNGMISQSSNTIKSSHRNSNVDKKNQAERNALILKKKHEEEIKRKQQEKERDELENRLNKMLMEIVINLKDINSLIPECKFTKIVRISNSQTTQGDDYVVSNIRSVTRNSNNQVTYIIHYHKPSIDNVQQTITCENTENNINYCSPEEDQNIHYILGEKNITKHPFRDPYKTVIDNIINDKINVQNLIQIINIEQQLTNFNSDLEAIKMDLNSTIQQGGSKSKKYIQMKSSKKRYIVKQSSDKKKYIIMNKVKTFLSSLRGKFIYVTLDAYPKT